MRTKCNQTTIGVLIFLLFLVGCATTNYQKPVPKISQPISVTILKEKEFGMFDLPPGVYNIPGTKVFLSGHQGKNDARFGAMFGVLGVLAADSKGSEAGAKILANVKDSLSLSLDEQVQLILKEKISSKSLNDSFVMTKTPNSLKLDIAPALLLNYISETEALPFLILKATIKNEENKKIWATRVFSSTGAPKPIAGDKSWTDNNLYALNNFIQINTRRAVTALLRDIMQPFPRSESDKIIVQSYFAFVKPRIQVMGYRLFEDDDLLLFIPSLPDANLYTGITALDKSNIAFRPATIDDPVVKTVDSAEK